MSLPASPQLRDYSLSILMWDISLAVDSIQILFSTDSYMLLRIYYNLISTTVYFHSFSILLGYLKNISGIIASYYQHYLLFLKMHFICLFSILDIVFQLKSLHIHVCFRLR